MFRKVFRTTVKTKHFPFDRMRPCAIPRGHLLLDYIRIRLVIPWRTASVSSYDPGESAEKASVRLNPRTHFHGPLKIGRAYSVVTYRRRIRIEDQVSLCVEHSVAPACYRNLGSELRPRHTPIHTCIHIYTDI